MPRRTLSCGMLPSSLRRHTLRADPAPIRRRVRPDQPARPPVRLARVAPLDKDTDGAEDFLVTYVEKAGSQPTNSTLAEAGLQGV